MTKKFNYKLYNAISNLSQENLHLSLVNFLNKRYGEEKVVEVDDTFIFAIGTIPICLVAHLDTVHKELPHQMFYDREEEVIWSPQGLGADDRAGVYAIMELVKRGLRPHILFTWDEEIGGVGAATAAQLLQTCHNVDFCIELDRRGKNDSVYYDCDNEDFENYINSFGFDTAIGSFSDISFICPEWGVAGVNLSIGYENEHTKSEMLNVDWMMDTIDKVEKICYNKEYDKDKFKFIEAQYNSNISNYWSSWSSWSYTPEKSKACAYSEPVDDVYKYNYSGDTDEICYSCCGIFPAHKVIPIDGETYCDDCYDRTFEYCNKCKKLYKNTETCACK